MGQGLHMPAWNALMLVPRHKQDFYWEYFRMHNRQIICMHDNFSTEKFQMNPWLKGAGSFPIHRKTMKDLWALAVLGVREQPILAQNLVTHSQW